MTPRVPHIGWRWAAPDVRAGSSWRTPREAENDALAHALAGRLSAVRDLPEETRAGLWRSLQTKGWKVEEVRPW